MKKALVLIACLVMGLLVFCGCDDGNSKVVDQTSNLSYEIDMGWNSKTVTPSPATAKVYDFGDYKIQVEALSYQLYEDPLQEAIDYAIGETDLAGAGYETGAPGDGFVPDMQSKEVFAKSIEDDGTVNYLGMFTAVETETGIYTLSTITESLDQEELIKEKHQELKESVEYVSAGDPEIYTENLLQFSDYICSAPGWDTYVVDTSWWTSRTSYENGVISYVFDYLFSLIVVPMEAGELTDETIAETLALVYNGNLGPEAECVVADRKDMDASIGSAVYLELDLKFGETAAGTAKSSAVFVLDEEGQTVCCFTNTSDYELTYNYASITTTMQKSALVYEQIDTIFESKTEYVGNNSEVSALLDAIGFGKYGEYTLQLETDAEPYGVTVNYKGDVGDYDFQREAMMTLGLVGNLDYVKIKDSNSDIVEYDYELAKSLMRYDVKKLAEDKARLECYFLETLVF